MALFILELENATTVVKPNALRHYINRVKIEHFAQTRSQKIYVFPVLHGWVKSTSRSYLCAEDLLQQTD